MNAIPVRLSLLGIVLSLAALTACESAPGLDKQFGVYYEYLHAPAGVVAEAASRAVREMGLQVISDEPTENGTKIVTRNSFNTKIIVTAKGVGPESTKVGIRVFPGESEGLSLSVMSKIKSNL